MKSTGSNKKKNSCTRELSNIAWLISENRADLTSKNKKASNKDNVVEMAYDLDSIKEIKKSKLHSNDVNTWIRSRHFSSAMSKYLFYPKETQDRLDLIGIFDNFDYDGNEMLELDEFLDMFISIYIWDHTESENSQVHKHFKATREIPKDMIVKGELLTKITNFLKEEFLNFYRFQTKKGYLTKKEFICLALDKNANMYFVSIMTKLSEMIAKANKLPNKSIPFSFENLINYLGYSSKRDKLYNSFLDLKDLSIKEAYKKMEGILDLANENNKKTQKMKSKQAVSSKSQKTFTNLDGFQCINSHVVSNRDLTDRYDTTEDIFNNKHQNVNYDTNNNSKNEEIDSAFHKNLNKTNHSKLDEVVMNKIKNLNKFNYKKGKYRHGYEHNKTVIQPHEYGGNISQGVYNDKYNEIISANERGQSNWNTASAAQRMEIERVAKLEEEVRNELNNEKLTQVWNFKPNIQDQSAQKSRIVGLDQIELNYKKPQKSIGKLRKFLTSSQMRIQTFHQKYSSQDTMVPSGKRIEIKNSKNAKSIEKVIPGSWFHLKFNSKNKTENYWYSLAKIVPLDVVEQPEGSPTKSVSIPQKHVSEAAPERKNLTNEKLLNILNDQKTMLLESKPRIKPNTWGTKDYRDIYNHNSRFYLRDKDKLQTSNIMDKAYKEMLEKKAPIFNNFGDSTKNMANLDELKLNHIRSSSYFMTSGSEPVFDPTKSTQSRSTFINNKRKKILKYNSKKDTVDRLRKLMNSCYAKSNQRFFETTFSGTSKMYDSHYSNGFFSYITPIGKNRVSTSTSKKKIRMVVSRDDANPFPVYSTEKSRITLGKNSNEGIITGDTLVNQPSNIKVEKMRYKSEFGTMAKRIYKPGKSGKKQQFSFWKPNPRLSHGLSKVFEEGVSSDANLNINNPDFSLQPGSIPVFDNMNPTNYRNKEFKKKIYMKNKDSQSIKNSPSFLDRLHFE